MLEPYRAVWVDIAKVASSSLKSTFAAVVGIDLAPVHGNPHRIRFPRPPAPEIAGERLYPDLYSFAFVRDPWDRLVSCYRDKIGGEVSDFRVMAPSGVAVCLAPFASFQANMSFDAFVDAVVEIADDDADEHFRSQYCGLVNAAGDVAVDFVGRYERLASDFAEVASAIGLPVGIRLPRLQANPHPAPYASFYTPRTRDAVARRYARDLVLFGHRFQSLPDL